MWFSFGSVDIGEELRGITDQNWLILAELDRIDVRQTRIETKVNLLMALVTLDQSVLDEIASEVSTAADLLQSIIDSPTPTLPADLEALNAAITKLQNVGVKVTPPEVPVEDAPPAEDGGDVVATPEG